jgi:hypothetical protein
MEEATNRQGVRHRTDEDPELVAGDDPESAPQRLRNQRPTRISDPTQKLASTGIGV